MLPKAWAKHISRTSAYNGVKSGEIPSIRIGRRIVVPTAALFQMLELGVNEPQGGLATDPGSRASNRHVAVCDQDVLGAGPKKKDPSLTADPYVGDPSREAQLWKDRGSWVASGAPVDTPSGPNAPRPGAR